MTELNQIDLRTLVTGNKRAWDSFVTAAAPLINAVVRRTLASYRLSEEDVMDAAQDAASTAVGATSSTAAAVTNSTDAFVTGLATSGMYEVAAGKIALSVARGVRREYSVGRMAERAIEVYGEAARTAPAWASASTC